MNLKNAVNVESMPDPAVGMNNKVAACAISLGVSIVNNLIGVEISGIVTENYNQLIATVINNELKI